MKPSLISLVGERPNEHGQTPSDHPSARIPQGTGARLPGPSGCVRRRQVPRGSRGEMTEGGNRA
jgi:hypothetical protein